MANTNPKKLTGGYFLRTDDEFDRAVEELRRLQTPIPTKADAIRAAVVDALQRAKTKAKKR